MNSKCRQLYPNLYTCTGILCETKEGVVKVILKNLYKLYIVILKPHLPQWLQEPSLLMIMWDAISLFQNHHDQWWWTFDVFHKLHTIKHNIHLSEIINITLGEGPEGGEVV